MPKPKKPQPREMVTPHFAAEEFRCPCCGVAPPVADTPAGSFQLLVSALETLRERVGVPIQVTSGYRCPKQNAKDGGKPHSQHMLGIAADITAECGWRALYEAALKIPAFAEGGIGVYPNPATHGFVHLDVRPAQARWARVKGKYVGIEAGLSA
jgi:zinc D-Ala-D-Ala carboxypeptidase